MFLDFQVAPGGGVQMQRILALFQRQAGKAGQGGFLRVAHVLQQRPGRAQSRPQVIAAKAAEIAHGKLRRQGAAASVGIKVPGRQMADQSGLAALRRIQILRKQGFGRCQSRDFRWQRRGLDFAEADAAGAQIEPGQAEARARGREGRRAGKSRVRG